MLLSAQISISCSPGIRGAVPSQYPGRSGMGVNSTSIEFTMPHTLMIISFCRIHNLEGQVDRAVGVNCGRFCLDIADDRCLGIDCNMPINLCCLLDTVLSDNRNCIRALIKGNFFRECAAFTDCYFPLR